MGLTGATVRTPPYFNSSTFYFLESPTNLSKTPFVVFARRVPLERTVMLVLQVPLDLL